MRQKRFCNDPEPKHGGLACCLATLQPCRPDPSGVETRNTNNDCNTHKCPRKFLVTYLLNHYLNPSYINKIYK